jgi:hypothetical protein
LPDDEVSATGRPATATVQEVDAVARLLRRRAGGELWLPVLGPSMEPAILTGSRVRVVGRTRPRPGEVWAFCTVEGSIFVHRCEGRIGGSFVFRGDAAAHADRSVPAAHLIGIVVEIAGPGGSRIEIGRRHRARSLVRATRRRLRRGWRVVLRPGDRRW